jgi:hypothetical protein
MELVVQTAQTTDPVSTNQLINPPLLRDPFRFAITKLEDAMTDDEHVKMTISSMVCNIESNFLQSAIDSLTSTGSVARDAVVVAELEPVKTFCHRIVSTPPEAGYDLGQCTGYSDGFFRNVAENVLTNMVNKEFYACKWHSPTAALTFAKRLLGTLGANSVHIRVRALSSLFETITKMLNHTSYVQQPSLFDLSHLSSATLLVTDIRAVASLDPVLSFLSMFMASIINEWFSVSSQRQQALNGCVYEYLAALDEVTVDAVTRMGATLRAAEISNSIPVIVPAFKSIFHHSSSQMMRVPESIDKLGLAADFVASKIQLRACSRKVVEEIVRQLKQFYAARAAQRNKDDELLEARVLQGTCFAATVFLTAALGEMVVVGAGLWDQEDEANGEQFEPYMPEPTSEQALEDRRWTTVYSHVERRIEEDLKPIIQAATLSVVDAKIDMRVDVKIVALITKRLTWLIQAIKSGEKHDLCEFIIPPSTENLKRLGLAEPYYYIGSDLLSSTELRNQGEWCTDTNGVRFTTSPQALQMFEAEERKRHVALHASMVRKLGEMLARVHKQRAHDGLECRPLTFFDTEGVYCCLEPNKNST